MKFILRIVHEWTKKIEVKERYERLDDEVEIEINEISELMLIIEQYGTVEIFEMDGEYWIWFNEYC